MAAPPLANTFEGGSDGTTISIGNSGAASGDAFDNVTIGASCTVAFQNNPAGSGLTGHMTMAATAAATHIDWTGLGSLTSAVYFRLYLYKTGTPAGTWFWPMEAFNNAASRCFGMAITNGNLLRWDNAAGTSVGTSTITVPSNQWVRIEAKVVPSTTVGTIDYRLYLTADAAIGSYDETKSFTALALLANIDQVQYGLMSTVTNMNSANWYYDNLAISTTDWLGPATPPIPPQQIRPDADTAAGAWTTTPLWSKVDEASAGGDVITDTAA